jgi:Fe-Mn family superoxide dismutase
LIQSIDDSNKKIKKGVLKMAHNLPDLPYAYDALEPFIDAQTMEIHHSKHHAAYVSKLNTAVEGNSDLQSADIEKIVRDLSSVPENIRTAVRNNGGGHYNHSVFWQLMGANKGGSPVGDIASAIDAKFGGFDQFKSEFSTAAVNRFGSGWAWLVINSGGDLEVTSTPNQDNPITDGSAVVLGLDVWEHAYYLKYQNRRPEYIENWWNVVDWEAVNERYLSVK